MRETSLRLFSNSKMREISTLGQENQGYLQRSRRYFFNLLVSRERIPLTYQKLESDNNVYMLSYYTNEFYNLYYQIYRIENGSELSIVNDDDTDVLTLKLS